MIGRGTVNARLESVVHLRIRGPGGTDTIVPAIVDTGFTGFLTLPPSTVAVLHLPPVSTKGVKFGDGVIRQVDSHEAEVEWGGVWRPVVAYATGREALIGLQLLAGHDLRIAVTPGGAVEITPLP